MIIFITCDASYSFYTTSTIIDSSSTIVSSSMTIVVISIVICCQLILVNNFSLVNYLIVLLVLHIEYTDIYIMWGFFTYDAPFFLQIPQIIGEVLYLVWCDFLEDFTIVFGLNQLNFFLPFFSMSKSVFCMSFHYVDCTQEVCIS